MVFDLVVPAMAAGDGVPTDGYIPIMPLSITSEDDLRTTVSAADFGDFVLGADFVGANTLTTQLTIARDLTLDLNGHTLTIDLSNTNPGGQISNGIQINNGIELTIIDSGDGGTLNVTNNATIIT